MSFGNRLKQIRIESSFSQKYVADKLGISVNTVSQYENDNRFPNEKTLRHIAKLFNISLDYLLELTNEKHAPIASKEINTDSLQPNQARIINELIEMINSGRSNDENF